MRLTAAALLFHTALGMLSVDYVRFALHQPFEKDKSIYIKPDGPLNLIYGYTYHKDKLASKMRLLSPAFKINYTLTKSNAGDDKFEINNNKDRVNTFKGNRSTAIYLTAYYKVFKEMFNVANNEVNIHTARKSSLFMFLNQNLDEITCFRLLAAMILLAEGVDVPLKFIDIQITLNKLNIPAPILICQHGTDKPLFEIKMYGIDNKPKNDNEPDSTIPEEQVLYKLRNIKKVIELFTKYGGNNVKRLKPFGILFNDTPRFLIHAYVFELVDDVNDARKLFEAVRELLKYTGNKERSKKWNLFFTKDIKEVEKYEPTYEIFQAVDRAISEIRFPFSAYNQPPSHAVVNGYDRKKGEDVKSQYLRFSDCCDVAIYTIFCCSFYKSIDRMYKLDHLEGRGYAPSEDLSIFFRDTCPKPVENTSQTLHQRWTHVVQDLVLSEGELNGEGAYGKNTIVYCKEEYGVNAEIRTDLINVLRVVAKVSGMPKERIKELSKIDSMVRDIGVNWKDLRNNIEVFTAQVLQDISIMPVKVNFKELRLIERNSFRGVYGKVEFEFTSASDDNLSVTQHILRFSFKDGHSSAIVANNCKIDSNFKDTLADLIPKCNDIDEFLGKKVVVAVKRFFERRRLEPIPLEVVRKIEMATNELERYFMINKVLMDYQVEVMDDKLYLIDLFGPYLERMTAKDTITEEIVIDKAVSQDGVLLSNPKESVALQTPSNTDILTSKAVGPSNMIEVHDPIIQLIINVMGTAQLGNTNIQKYFVKIFGFCNEERKRLFPNFFGDDKSFDILSLNADLREGEEVISNNTIFREMMWEFMPNLMLRLWKTFRELHGERFFEVLCSKEDLHLSYYTMIGASLTTKSPSGIAAFKNDLKIRDGLIEPGLDAYFITAIWFSNVIQAEYQEGIEITCNSWKRICGEDNFFSLLFQKRPMDIILYWGMISDDFLEKLNENEFYREKLVEIHCYFSMNTEQFDIAYAILVAYSHNGALFKVLYNSIRKTIWKEYNYLLSVINSDYIIVYDEAYKAVKYIDDFHSFINQVDIFRNGILANLMEQGRSDPRFDGSFEEMYRQLGEMREPLDKIVCNLHGFARELDVMFAFIDSIFNYFSINEKLERMREYLRSIRDRFYGYRNNC